MNIRNECVFCRASEIMKKLPSKSVCKEPVPCNRAIYEDDYCIATLAPEQSSEGYTILALKNHRTDITDSDISKEELLGFISAIHRLVIHLKDRLRDNDNNHPERIYVGILCNGVEHLHAHLIPRYPFTEEDKETYKRLFEPRDGIDQVDDAIMKGKLGGFWYVAERERNYKRRDFWKKSDEERARYLEDLAQRLKLSL